MKLRLVLNKVPLAAALLTAASATNAQSAAERMVEQAQQYSGTTLSVLWESGLQAQDPISFSGPMWEALTGIKVDIHEVDNPKMFKTIVLEHRNGNRRYDALNVVPAWMPDLAMAGILEPLDDYVDRYSYREELDEIEPVFRDNQMTVNGKIYGLPDDGDVLLLYYRIDIFNDEDNRSRFKAEHGYDLAPPRTWKQFSEIGRFLTEKYAPQMYGAALIRDPSVAQFMFQERFRVEGGRFFDPDTMQATINSDVGVRVLREMREENAFMPPDVLSHDFVANLSAFLEGRIAMTISWPPYGRWAAGYGTQHEALSWVPKSKVAGKVGYALPPGGRPQLAGGFSLSVSAISKNKEAAYLFIQWLNSREISLQRVQLPYALRDPFRESHFASEEYRSLWPEAPQYLDTLAQATRAGLLDLSLLQVDKYEAGLRLAFKRLWAGHDPKTILDDLAIQWNNTTAHIGVKRQQAAYQNWASKPNAYPH